MELTPDIKRQIDAMSLEDMLSKWRFSASGDEMFQGESGAYFSTRMFGLRDADNDAWVRASKSVGWERRG